MIAHKTFSDRVFHWSWRAYARAYESIREQANAWINEHLDPEDIISIAETGENYGAYLFTVTVWYRTGSDYRKKREFMA